MMGSLFCPFCPFSDPSHYFLSQHVETCHPEADESPFVSRHFLEEDKVENVGRKETAITLDAPSQDYIECECGEAVLLAEFDDHVQLHTAESAESADMVVDSAQLPEGVTLSPPDQHIAWPAATSPLHLVDLNTVPAANNATKSPSHAHEARSSKLKHASRSNINKQHATVKEWVDLLLGSTARTKIHSTHHKDVRRLGVSRNHKSELCRRLIYQTESGARSLCSRGANAGMAIQTVGTWRQSFNS